MNTAKIREEYGYSYTNQSYQSIPQEISGSIVEGFFPETAVKNMAIRRLNTILCMLLGVVIAITSISYYFATANEITLNELSRQTTVLNDENAELQIKLDKLKSFNNVDKEMQRNNMFQKAKHVIEVAAVSNANVPENKLTRRMPFPWSIGY